MNLSSKISLGSRSRLAAGTLFSVGLLAVALTNPSVWLQSGFETAISNSTAGGSATHAKTGWTQPVAGSEAYWLAPRQPSQTDALVHSTNWQAPVAKGDRFSIMTSGQQTEFEVTEIVPLSVAAAEHATSLSTHPADHFVVVCKSIGHDRAQTVKFLVEPGAPLPWVATQSRQAHAL